MGKRTEPVENADYGAMVVRLVKALGRRVAEGDPEDMRLIREAREALSWAEGEALVGLMEQGHSVRQIGAALGISGQAVSQLRNRHMRRGEG